MSNAQRVTVVTNTEHHGAILGAISRDHMEWVSGEIMTTITGGEVRIELVTAKPGLITSMILLKTAGADVFVSDTPTP